MITAPLLYRGELLYSGVIRCCRWYCLPLRVLLRECLNLPTQNFSFLSAKLASLAAGLFAVAAERLLWQHTIFPYATAFCSLPTYKSSLAAALEPGQPHGTLTGQLRHAARGLTYRRMCPECLKYELETIGESFWHTSHQLAGVLVCPVHHCALMTTDIPARSTDLNGMKLPHECQELQPATRNVSPGLRELAVSSAALLERVPGPGAVRGPTFYRDLASEQGLLAPQRSPNPVALTQALHNVFPEQQLAHFRVPVKQEDYWPSKLFHNTDYRTPVVNHLIMEVALRLQSSDGLAPLDGGSILSKRADSQKVDVFYAPKARKALRDALTAGEVLSIKEFMERFGGWSVYRWRKLEMPQTREVVRQYRESPAALDRVPPGTQLWGRKYRTKPGRRAKA